MPIFYKLDSVHATIGEHWWGCRRSPLSFLIVMLLKCLRLRNPMASDDANVDSTLPFVVESLPEEIAERFAPLAAELHACGFAQPVYHAIVYSGIATRIYWATFYHESGRHAARIHNRHWDLQTQRERAFFPIFFTAFTDGTFALSSSGRPDVAAPPEVRMNRLPGVRTADLWASHLQLVEILCQTKSIQDIRDTSDLLNQTERLHLVQRDFHLRRKFFRVPTAHESLNASAFTSRVDDARANGAQHPEVLAEIARLEEPKPRLANSIWLLIFSLVAFIGVGAAQWQWETTLWLIPLLLFHELGHWVAMKIFGYRNLRMFFIPFFGAAVAGQNRTLPGWKKAVVSLAGPLPGIILGAFLCIIALATGIPWLRRCTLLLLLLNVFNLVPLLPLDGGRFLQVTLFCRNRWLDLVFRLAAIVGLFFLSLKGFGRSLFVLPIFLAMSLPAAFQMGRITDRFKRTPLPPPLPGEQHLPPSTADTLAAAVKEALPRSSNRIVAQNVLNIYETLNARPPSALATLGLLVSYFGAIALAIVLIFSLVLTNHGSLADFIKAARSSPRQSVTLETIQLWQGTTPAPCEHFVITTLKNSLDARSEFNQYTHDSPSNAAVLLFGDSLIVGFPAHSETATANCLGQFSLRSTNTFATSTNIIRVALSFIAPNASVATNLQADLAVYFSIHGQHLIPPWDPVTESPDFASKLAARRVWNHIRRQLILVTATEMTADVTETMSHTNENGAERTNRLNGFRLRALPVHDQERARLAVEYAGTPYVSLIELNGQNEHLDLTNHLGRKAILSQVAEQLGRAETTTGPEAASGGVVTVSSLILRIPAMTVAHPETNLPQIINWLTRQNCQSIHYRVDSQ